MFHKQMHARSEALHNIIYMYMFHNPKCVVPITTLPPTKHQPLKAPHTTGHDTTHASSHVGIDCSTTTTSELSKYRMLIHSFSWRLPISTVKIACCHCKIMYKSSITEILAPKELLAYSIR